MKLLEASSALFESVLGPVEAGDMNRSFELLLKGMLGIFVVMLLIFLVIVILGKVSENRSKKEEARKAEQETSGTQENNP